VEAWVWHAGCRWSVSPALRVLCMLGLGGSPLDAPFGASGPCTSPGLPSTCSFLLSFLFRISHFLLVLVLPMPSHSCCSFSSSFCIFSVSHFSCFPAPGAILLSSFSFFSGCSLRIGLLSLCLPFPVGASLHPPPLASCCSTPPHWVPPALPGTGLPLRSPSPFLALLLPGGSPVGLERGTPGRGGVLVGSGGPPCLGGGPPGVLEWEPWAGG